MEDRGRVVVTGGTGLIGRALAAELVAHGYSVVALSRSAQSGKALSTGVTVLPWDAASAHGWEAAVDGAVAVVNLAGQSIASRRWTPAQKQRILESRRRAGEAVTAAVRAAHHRPSVVVQISGIGYYGDRDDGPLDESAEAGSDWLARVAVEWEASSAAVALEGVRHVVTRTGPVLSRQGGALPRMVLPFRAFVGGRLGSGNQWMSWIHLEDAVRAIRHLIELEDSLGAYNVVAPEPVTNRDFSRALGRVLHRPSWVRVPGFALRLMLGEMSSVLLTGQRAVPVRLLRSGFSFRYAALDVALASFWTG